MKPDDPLFIYEFEGICEDPQKIFKENFIAHWREGDCTFLFFSEPKEALIGEFIRDHGNLSWVRTHQMSYKEWQGGELLKPWSVGKFVFLPPWISLQRKPGKLNIMLDPGVVFGAGTHPTTRDCLQALLWIYEQEKPQKVLDLGTGTGILSLAAAALGAEEVLAVDLNPACVQTAEKNAEYNDLRKKIKIMEGRAEEYIHLPADLAVMNIHFAVIRELISKQSFFEKKWVVISGLLRSEFLEIKHQLHVPGFQLLKEWDSEFTWFTLAGRNKNGSVGS